MADVVEIEITKPLPEKAVVASTYKIEGSVKLFDAVGAPPWVTIPKHGLREELKREFEVVTGRKIQ